MRVLHPGMVLSTKALLTKSPARDTRDRGSAQRQLLPLHRIREDHQGRPEGQRGIEEHDGREAETVGPRVRKVDGYELVTGKAKYPGDMRFPGLVYGFAARSKIAAGTIKAIGIDAALRQEGVLAVLTGRDIPGPNLIGVLPPHDQPVLATDVIRYAGESIALVIAETHQAAKRAARAVALDVEPLTPILTVDEALKEGARKIHERGNVTFSKKLVKGDVEAGFAQADVILEDTFTTGNQEHAYIEPEVVCVVPSGDGRVTVYASCQSPFHLRGLIAANLALPASRVKVVQAATGGSFGGKDDVATEIGISPGWQP